MPLVYTGPADAVAVMKTLFRSGLPQDIASLDRDDEDVELFAEIMTLAESEVKGLMREIQVGTSHSVFLDQHARDDGERRAFGETDAQLKQRLQLPPAGGTVESVLDGLALLVGSNAVYVVELPLSSAYYDRGICLDRGVRMGGGRGVVIGIVPASANAAASAILIIRRKISAGKIGQVEEYTE